MAFCNFNEQQKIVMMVTFWVVWYSRNKLVHERILPSVPDSLSFIQAFIRECGSPISLVAVEPTLPCSKWSASALNIVKNNFDAAFDVQSLACLQAVIFAIELGFRNVVFEDDSLAVIKRVSASSSDYYVISPIVNDIREVVKGLESADFNFVHREGNNAAHALARSRSRR
ncbi:hypothetical protein V6N12_000140 [Hibiscus sabdariffa]|uniref:RNase H type-1 domain-containing protein n=1 Tax=Hibiscus sabdariffa TaxID=183260 RepID=A0ABR2B0P8_9ROSI